MNEILLALLSMIVLWSVMWWIVNRRYGKTYTEILITYPFEDLVKGKIAMFKTGEKIKVGDFVLIRLPGYDYVWKVTKVNGEKVELRGRTGEVLIGFPMAHLGGKFTGYKDEKIFDKKDNKENQN